MVDNLTDNSFCYFTNENFSLTSLDCTPPTKQAIANTGATGNYVDPITPPPPHTNKQTAINPIVVAMPNSNTVVSTYTRELILPSLPEAARQAHIFPHLPAGALLSIGQLCDAGCAAEFDRTTFRIHHRGDIVLTGTQSSITKLWCIDPPASPPIAITRYSYAAQNIVARSPAFRTTP